MEKYYMKYKPIADFLLFYKSKKTIILLNLPYGKEIGDNL